MDKSKEYVVMCGCHEIQDNNCGPTPYVDKILHGNEILIVDNGDYWLCKDIQGESSTYDIWLPRQDQLQDMVNIEPEFPFNYIGAIGRFIDNNITYSCSFKSMEQLWLAFVMKEKFKKLWDGQEWIDG